MQLVVRISFSKDADPASPVASNRKLDRSLGVSFPGPGDYLLINLV